MKKLLFTTACILYPLFILYAQQVYTIKDAVSNQPVPYVNITLSDKSIGTTADENGRFTLDANGNKSIIFSAIGYAELNLPVNELKENILLQPQAIQLNEVIVSGKKQNIEQETGKIVKRGIDHFFGCSSTPWMVGRYFKMLPEYEKTPFIKTIRFYSHSHIKNSKINIRLYKPDAEGKPGEAIYNENIICTVKHGNRVSEMNISDLNVMFPDEGLIVVFEWLIIEDNKHEYEYAMKGENKTRQGVSYQPTIGTVKRENQPVYIYSQGAWHVKTDAKDSFIDHPLNVELILSN